jgi:hypothetical protein
MQEGEVKEEQVRFHHIRDYPWPQKFCAKCYRMAPKFHEHFPKKYMAKIAYPEIKGGEK